MSTSYLAPVATPGSHHVDLGHGQTAHIRDDRLVSFNIRDPYRYAEQAAAKRAELRFRNRHARRTHMLELYRYATGSDPVPDAIAEDVAAVRVGMEWDEARRAEVTARARAAVGAN